MKKENGNDSHLSGGSPLTGESGYNFISSSDIDKLTTSHEQEIPAEDPDFMVFLSTARKNYGSISYPGHVWSDIRGRLSQPVSRRIPHRRMRVIAVIGAAAMVCIILLVTLNRERERLDTLPYRGTVFRSIPLPSGLPENLTRSVYFKIPDKPSTPSFTFSVPSLPKPPRERNRILSMRGVNHV